ncbi:MAG: DNA repair protein RadC [bacterium]|nr:DNA repair protein RadC [bacterium]
MKKVNFKEIPNQEKPRERLLNNGASSLSNEELLAIILKTGTKDMNVKDVSLLLLTKIENISDLKNMTYNKLLEVPGIGKVKAVELLAVMELGKRMYQNKTLLERQTFNHPSIIYNHFIEILNDELQENFYVVYLNQKKQYLDKLLLFKGTINCSTIHPREIFKNAYLMSASYIICVHNHPSGNPCPSKQDVYVTKQIEEIGIIHGIALLDHIIIGNTCYFSFYEKNYLSIKK